GVAPVRQSRPDRDRAGARPRILSRRGDGADEGGGGGRERAGAVDQGHGPDEARSGAGDDGAGGDGGRGHRRREYSGAGATDDERDDGVPLGRLDGDPQPSPSTT